MKNILLVVGVLALAIGTIGGTMACTTASGDSDEAAGQLNLDASYSGKNVEVTAGSFLRITLDSNPTTGFRWELASVSDEEVLRLITQEFMQTDAAQSGMLGAGGQEVWTFGAVGRGESTLLLEYSRPWEGGEKAVETFTVTVIVK